MTRNALVFLVALAALGSCAVIALGQSSSSTSGALFATANGRNVIAQDGARGAGDKNGFGSFTLIRSGGRLCYGLTVRGIGGPLQANLMRGSSANGSIVVNLGAPSSGSAGTRAGCVTVPSSKIAAIFANPGNYGVNVLTDDFRDGAIFGKLTGVAGGNDRTTIADCGSLGMNVQAITAQGTTCDNARAIAQTVAGSKSCQGQSSCTSHSYTCLLGQAGSELTLVHCENGSQTRFARFELGS